jgi:hypothetical protein
MSFWFVFRPKEDIHMPGGINAEPNALHHAASGQMLFYNSLLM